MKLHEILCCFFECDNENICVERPSLPNYRFHISKETPWITVETDFESFEQVGFLGSDFIFEDWKVYRPNRKRP